MRVFVYVMAFHIHSHCAVCIYSPNHVGECRPDGLTHILIFPLRLSYRGLVGLLPLLEILWSC